MPFGGKLSKENRWVKLAEIIPWEVFEQEYAAQLHESWGAPAKPFRMALGALIIKERLGTSDRETVEQIRENPYLQYFLGQTAYSDSAPFEASMLVHFRKRISLEMIGRINEQIVLSHRGEDQGETDSQAASPPTAVSVCDDEDELPPNEGQLIVDASCAPADISYPTDLKLLNQAREHTEAIIDALYAQVQDQLERKPRTYRQQARREYLQVAKQRKTSRKARRKAVGKQLGYVGRNLGHIERLVAMGADLSQLPPRLYRLLLVISEVFRQQQWMYEHRQMRVEDRIVSLSQPHVRPMVRGKAGVPVEFGAKFSASCVNGMVFLDQLRWDSFNESGDLPEQIEQFKRRFGHYPQSVHADQIYRTRDNLKYCRKRGIRLSGLPLGRPALDFAQEVRQQAQIDARVRNQIEGKFGQGKRRFSLGRVMAKLATTSATSIAMTFLVMNLEALLRQLLFVFCTWMMDLSALLLEHWDWRQAHHRPMVRVA